MIWRLGLFIAILVGGVYFLGESLQNLTLNLNMTNAPQNELAEIVDIKGSVQVRRGNGAWKTLEPTDVGYVLFHNDEIQTGDGAELRLNSFGTVFKMTSYSFARAIENTRKQADFVFRHGSFKVMSRKPQSRVGFVKSSVATDWLEDSAEQALENLQPKIDRVIPLSPPRASVNPLPVDEESFDVVSPLDQIKTSLKSKNSLFKRCAINLFRQSKRPPSSVYLQFMVRNTGATDNVVVSTKSELATTSFKTCVQSVVERMKILNYDGPEMSLQFPLAFSAE